MMSGEMKTDKDKSLLQVMEEYKESVDNYLDLLYQYNNKTIKHD